MLQVRIRAVDETDLASIVAIESRVFSMPWSPGAFLYELKQNPHTEMIAAILPTETGSKLVGYTVWWMIAGEAQIGNVAVDPDYRRRGVGRQLIQACLEQCKAEKAYFITLDVRVSNTAAINLYRSFGFKEVGRRRGYYSKPVEDAVLMTKVMGSMEKEGE